MHMFNGHSRVDPEVFQREGDLVADRPHEELAAGILHDHTHGPGPPASGKRKNLRAARQNGTHTHSREERPCQPIC